MQIFLQIKVNRFLLQTLTGPIKNDAIFNLSLKRSEDNLDEGALNITWQYTVLNSFFLKSLKQF